MPPCNAMPNVILSADVTQNTNMGGHVLQHIYGMRPPVGTSQVGKTLFSSRGKYEAAWRQYRYVANPRNCGGGGQAQQTVSLAALNIQWLDAYSCTAANGNGECTAYTMYMASDVFFGFLLVGSVWILNTCFPVPMT